MARERIAAIIIGAIMILSAAGFALNSAMDQGMNQEVRYDIPTIVTRQLTLEETRYVLAYEGKVIIEYNYDENCTDCAGKQYSLEGFARRMNEFVVLQELKGNETSVQIIGAGGKIVDLSGAELTEQSLMEKLCEVAIAQPSECLMNEI